MKRIAIFASGTGTNAENIIRYFKDLKSTDFEISLVVSNRSAAPVLQRAEALGIPTLVFTKESWRKGEDVLNAMHNYKIDFIVLAGFLALVPTALIEAYPDRIVNIHPALLPKYGGKGMYGDRVHEAVIANREKESGITIHYINQNFDEGQPIVQYKCPVLDTDTAATLAQRVHALEYQHYPEVIERIANAIN